MNGCCTGGILLRIFLKLWESGADEILTAGKLNDLLRVLLQFVVCVRLYRLSSLYAIEYFSYYSNPEMKIFLQKSYQFNNSN